jgi:hypothetical protein
MKIVSINQEMTDARQVCFVTEPPFDEERFVRFERFQPRYLGLKQYDWTVEKGMLVMLAGAGFDTPIFPDERVKIALGECLEHVEQSMQIRAKKAANDEVANLKQAQDAAKLFNVPLS